MKNRLPEIKEIQLDKTNTFIELNSPYWRGANKLSLENLQNLLSINPDTLQVEINSSSVFSEPYNNHNLYYNRPPKDSSDYVRLTLATDDNYLYVWIESQKRWKRALLTEW